MKKILSVSLIVIMILAMGLSALGIGAEEVPAPTVGITEEATGADATTAGNLTEPGSKTFDSSWTAISDEAGLNSMAADGKYYLTGNITVTSTRNNTANQTIDGNGYTITANCPIFNEVKGLTLQNVTIKSTLNHNADGNVTALAKWNSDSKPVCVYNVTLEADIVSVKNNGNHQYFGGFVMRSCAGSEFKNVVVTTNVTLDNAEVAIVNSVGGIVARAQGTTFDNCIANGTFTFKQDPFKDNNVTDSGVGGIAGAATNNSVIKNCTNNVVFNVDAPKSSNLQGIGGIVGFSNAGTTFENCVNNGNITTGEAATGWWLGGIVGNYYGGISIQKCKNTADINCVAADYVGGILGYSHKANANISNCLNTGDISGPYAVGGIVGFGAKESGDCVIKNSTNAGKITGSVYAGGIAGYIGLGSVSLCSTTEESEILLTGTCTMKDQDTYAASILASGASLVSDCEAYGSVTVDGAATTSAIYAGGVVGRINNGGAVKNCVNYATVTVRNTSRFVAAAGVLANTGWAATLDNCVNHADITVEETVQFLNQNDWGNAIGGVAGKLNANSTITNSVNKGKIEDKGAESDGDVGVGGILGFFAAANLTIEDCTNEGELISKSYAGGILGNALNRNTQAGNVITIKDSCNKGTVTADKRAGGIVGYVQKIDFGASHIAEIAKVDVSDCTNNATVYGGSYAGGIVSAVEATATVINNCANNSEVSGGNVGGIIGSSKSALSITNAINNGKVKAGNSAGGIICLVDSGSTAAIENCVNLGTVEGAYRTAGIAGFIKGAVTATNCVNGAEGDNTKGLIKTTSGDAWGAAGGIFGWVEGADCSMKGCINYVPIYAYGNSTNADAGMAGAGGLVGKAAKTVIIGGTQEGEACLNYGAVTAENNAGAGGIIGGMNANMTFANCHNYADVFAIGASAGSVVGRVGGNVTITGIVNELSSGKVRGYGYLGSLIGGADGTVTLDGIVSNEDNIVPDEKLPAVDPEDTNAKKPFMYIGGIIGHNKGTLTLKNCVNKAHLTISRDYGTGEYHLGGIIGYAQGDTNLYSCKNDGNLTTTEDYWYMGGLVSRSDARLVMNGCVNNGALRATIDQSNYVVVGGVFGYKFRGTLNISACVNNGDLILTSGDGRKANFGGIVGRTYDVNKANGVDGAVIEGCINNGNVIGIVDRAGGIVGMFQATNTDDSIRITNCVNYGNINGRHAAGILGYVWLPEGNSREGWVYITTCQNNGEIYGVVSAAGIVGSDSQAGARFVVHGCSNMGTIKGEVKLSGILAGLSSGSTAYITETVALGKMVPTTTKWYKLGDFLINFEEGYEDGKYAFMVCDTYRGIENYFTFTYVDNKDGTYTIKPTQAEHERTTGKDQYGLLKGVMTVTKTDSGWTISFDADGEGEKAASNASRYSCTIYGIAPSTALLENCGFLTTIGAPGGNLTADVVAAGGAKEDWGFAFYKLQLKLKLEEIDKFISGTHESLYDASTWENLMDARDEAKAALEADVISLYENDGMWYAAINTQYRVNEAYSALVSARENLLFAGTKKDLLGNAIAEAEKLYESDEIYTAESWKAFVDALNVAKAMLADQTLESIDVDEVYEVIAALNNAIDSLVCGGEIYSSEDFARLDGKNGTYYLMCDVTLDKALTSFSGKIYGNGHTVTLNGCALFELVDGTLAVAGEDEVGYAQISNLKIAGEIGEAASIFGRAQGNVVIDNVIIEVESVATAAIFDSAAADAEITLEYIVSYADAGVGALLGKVGCKVNVRYALCLGEAPTVIASSKNTSTYAVIYLAGVEYYAENGFMSTDASVLASGQIAYEFNKNFANAENAEIAKLTLGQVIGYDALPTVSALAADGSNEVILKDGEYVNRGFTYTGDLDGAITPDVPKLPVYAALEASIANAMGLDKELYTELSWNALLTALEYANAALELDDQARIDAAKDSLDVAIASLVKKTDAYDKAEGPDYEALNAAINAAIKLKPSKYTTESWSAFQSVLAAAKTAKNSDSQTVVDTALEALNKAVAALVEIAPEVEDESETDDVVTPETEAEGCGSVIGGVAVVFTAMIALAGISLKKKED